MPVHSSKRRLFRWMAYLLVGFLSLVIALVCAGAIYEATENHRDRRLYHPPGRLLDIGGYRLHLYCIGEGSPTVILEAGAGIRGCSGTRFSHRRHGSAGFVRMTAQDLDGVIPARGPERPE